MAQKTPVGKGLHIFEVSRSYSVRHAIFGRTPLGEWSARRKNSWLHTTLTTDRQISMPEVGFEPAIPKCGRSQTPLFRLLTICVLKERSLVLYCTVQSRSYENSMFDIATLLFRLLFSNFRDWCRWSGMRWRGWTVGFPHSSAVLWLTLSSGKFSVPLNDDKWLHNLLNEII